MKPENALSTSKRKINLIYNSSKTATFKQLFKRALFNCLPLIVIISVGLLTVRPMHRTVTPLSTFSQLDLFRDIREGSLLHAHESSDISELRKNFLTNERIQSEHLNAQFKESGLAHLLALSGGQTGPAAQFFGTLFMFSFIAVLRIFKPFNIARWLNFLRGLSCVVHTTILMFLVGLYQSTGALNRTLSEQINNTAKACAMLQTNTNPTGSEGLLAMSRAIPWILGWVWHRNPVGDLSFLLSALGSTTGATLSSLRRRKLSPSNNQNNISGTFDASLIETLTRLTTPVLMGGLSCAVMSLLTWPLWPPGNILEKISANLLAGPCVLYIVTPATLGVAFGQLLGQPTFTDLAQNFLDLGLHGLLVIAQTFSENPTTVHAGAEANHKPNLSLNIALVILNLEIIALLFVREWACLRVRAHGWNPENRTAAGS